MDKAYVRLMQFLLKWLIVFFIFVFSMLIIFRFILLNKTRARIKTDQTIPPTYDVIIVFGAGINPNNLPTKVLRDRLDKTIQLLNLNRFEKVLLSGGKTSRHNEAQVMNTYLTDRGISPKLLVMDEAGTSTFDTLKRAREIYQISAAILITQRFHLPRAVAIASSLEMDVIGIPADTKVFRKTSLLWWHFRELFAWVWTFIKIKTR